MLRYEWRTRKRQTESLITIYLHFDYHLTSPSDAHYVLIQFALPSLIAFIRIEKVSCPRQSGGFVPFCLFTADF
jgi:hypothetical protein